MVEDRIVGLIPAALITLAGSASTQCLTKPAYQTPDTHDTMLQVIFDNTGKVRSGDKK